MKPVGWLGGLVVNSIKLDGCFLLSSLLFGWLGGWVRVGVDGWGAYPVDINIQLTLLFFLPCFFPSFFLPWAQFFIFADYESKKKKLEKKIQQPQSLLFFHCLSGNCCHLTPSHFGDRVVAALGQISTGSLFFIKPPT